MLCSSSHSYLKVLQTLLSQVVITYRFSGLGKATFCNASFSTEFITGESQYIHDSLPDTLLDNDAHKQEFLAFLCLVCTVYLKKHATAFESNLPKSHFESFLNLSTDVQEQHINWLKDIHQNTWEE